MGFTLPNGTLPPPPPPPPPPMVPIMASLKTKGHTPSTTYRCYVMTFANPNQSGIKVHIHFTKNCYIDKASYAKGDKITVEIPKFKSKSMYLFIPYPRTKTNTPEDYLNWHALDNNCCAFMTYTEIIQKDGFKP
jgi:hypothetical protein